MKLGSKESNSPYPFTLQTRLFQGGFQDFISDPSPSDFIDYEAGPTRSSPLESLIYYWNVEEPPGFNRNCPTLFSLSFYALKINAAEWLNYLELMYHSIKPYEYSPQTISPSLEHITVLTANICYIQQWARRNMATVRKIRYVLDFLKYRVMEKEDLDHSSLLREDYEQIALDLDTYTCRLQSMVSANTSLIQANDSRRSLTETMNISRLTYLALGFIPLTFVSGIFSMNDNIAPGGRLFGLYFAVSIPLSIIVFLIIHPPRSTSGRLPTWVGRSKQMQRVIV